MDVEEVVQETFTKVFQHIERLTWRGEDAFLSWLVGIAQNIILGASRKTRCSHLRLEHDVEARDVSPAAARVVALGTPVTGRDRPRWGCGLLGGITTPSLTIKTFTCRRY
jgi:DNA-directed RNA polymerase specialized sigma24 family protein